MITLNDSAIALIRTNKTLKKAITTHLDCSDRILYRDLASNSLKLTQLGVVNLIVEHTKLPLHQLITGDKLSKFLT